MNWERIQQEMMGQPVRSLQFMLRRLAQRYPFLPEVTPDGLFGERTLESVMQFQKHLYPPVTGRVDQGTWRAIQQQWLKLEEELSLPRPLRGFPGGTRMSQGDSSPYLYPIQAMFQSLSQVLEGIGQEEIDGILSGSSVDNVRWLQRRAQLEETGELDRETWDALTRLYELFSVSRGWPREGESALRGRG